jgi:hypothetical protein
MRQILIALIALTLTGCAQMSAVESPFDNLLDDQSCRNQGVPGSQAYAECREDLAHLKQEETIDPNCLSCEYR